MDIRDLNVFPDQTRDTLELRTRIGATPELPARSLSDGTLRFLAPSAMKVSRDYFGMLCMEESENGIHSSKITDMHRLLQGISEPTETSARQVIVNTHSPYFVQATKDDDILCAVGKSIPDGDGGVLRSVGFHPLPSTWRTEGGSGNSIGPVLSLAARSQHSSRTRTYRSATTMNEWYCCLLCEGSSDAALTNVLELLLTRLTSETASVSARPDLKDSVQDKLLALQKNDAGLYDLVFVHRDADNAGLKARVDGIRHSAKSIQNTVATPVVPVVPVTMTETRALARLFDEREYRTWLQHETSVSGKRLESYKYPKELLRRLLSRKTLVAGYCPIEHFRIKDAASFVNSTQPLAPRYLASTHGLL